jgi:NAD+ kinase
MLLLSRIVERRVSQSIIRNYTSQPSATINMSEKSFLPKRALVLRKFSRLEYERLCHPNLTEEQLAANLSQRGSVYDSLRHYDSVQKSCLQQIELSLKSNAIEYQTVDKFGYTEDKINWADVIITSGGDGTFLMAASKVGNRDKPVIGINSDPTKSVGHLCLPSRYSNNFDKVIELLRDGKYKWQFKQRLRVTLIGDAADEEPKALNDMRYDMRGFFDQDFDQDRYNQQNDLNHHRRANHLDNQCNNVKFKTVDGKVFHKIRQLKERALNEVFVGETLSARVSYYELSVDSKQLIKMKSSGLTICTGTGSTSWYYNINKVTDQQVLAIVSIINKVTKKNNLNPNDSSLIGDITKQFNDSLTFGPTEPIMAYSIRDPIGYASAVGHSHRGHAKRIEVKSRMQNACLVLDGCQFIPFNDGSYALIEMYDEDALKTISLE